MTSGICPACGKRFVSNESRQTFCSRECYLQQCKISTVAERFWSKISKDGHAPDPDRVPGNCWRWMGSKDGRGYGTLNISRVPKKAHRVSWELHHGSIPEGMEICHKCDNPECSNPEHLFLGSHQDNMSDMSQKKRYSVPGLRGQHHPMCKLTEADVLEILRLRKTGKLIREIAELFGVSVDNVSLILRGRAWKHVTVA